MHVYSFIFFDISLVRAMYYLVVSVDVEEDIFTFFGVGAGTFVCLKTRFLFTNLLSKSFSTTSLHDFLYIHSKT